MNTFLRTGILLCCIHSFIAQADSWQYQSAKSFLYPRPLNHNIAATSFIWDTTIAQKNCDYRAALRILPLYQQSRDACSTARYFLLNCKETILVAGDDTSHRYDRDVRAEWLNLPGTFVGTLSLRPEQRQVGGLISYNQDLGRWLDFSWLCRLWFTCSVPIISVRQRLNPSECGAGIIQALNNPALCWGHMAPGTFQKTRLTEVDIGIGTSWTTRDDFLLWYQSTLDIPCSGKTGPEQIFLPVLGLNGHLVWTNEFAAALPLHPEEASYTCKLMINLANHYYFSHNQHRVFDLHQKPWSRYLPLRNKTNPQLVVPAMNVLTQWVKIHPFNSVNLATGVRIGACGWVGEVGYQLWARRGERVQLLNTPCNTVPRPITQFGIADPNSNGTANGSTITQVGATDPVFITLTSNDINLYSGASQNALTQAAHMEIGYQSCWVWGAFGAFVENPHTNTALATWGVWGTLGFEF